LRAIRIVILPRDWGWTAVRLPAQRRGAAHAEPAARLGWRPAVGAILCLADGMDDLRFGKLRSFRRRR
jgi:hypothetical protein